MNSNFPLAVLLLVAVSASLYFLLQAEGGIGELPGALQRAGVPLDKLPMVSVPNISLPKAVPAEYVSGSSRYSQGACLNDIDCAPTGCSGEICSGEGEMASTCEFSEDFPNARGYACACVHGSCGWER